jgi:hypothetical protein
MRMITNLQEVIAQLAAACRAEIEASDRPIDAFPIGLVVPVFWVRPEFRADWPAMVPVEAWQRINRLMGRFAVLMDHEAAIQDSPFALSPVQLREFRERPVLRMLSLTNHWLQRHRGGRTKHEIELAIREALEFETFRRSAEIGALSSCMRARFEGVAATVEKGAYLNELVRHAWVLGVPTKGEAADANLSDADRRLALFATLRSEGEKVAVKRLPGLASPAEAEAAVIGQIRALAAQHPWTREDFESAIAKAADWVKILMKGCAHVTEVAEEKHKVAKQADKLMKRRRAPKGNAAFGGEPATKRQLALFDSGEFSMLELAFIAVVADVDPNLVSPNHALASPEFRVARKLGRAGRGHQTSFEPEELSDLQHLILDRAGHAGGTMYQDVHRYLLECALELLPMDAWTKRSADALANKTRFMLPD